MKFYLWTGFMATAIMAHYLFAPCCGSARTDRPLKVEFLQENFYVDSTNKLLTKTELIR